MLHESTLTQRLLAAPMDSVDPYMVGHAARLRQDR